jgi:hypothetical protein
LLSGKKWTRSLGRGSASHRVRKLRAYSIAADYSHVGRSAMLYALETVLGKLGRYHYKRTIERALALHLRGRVLRDGLSPARVTTHLDIEWRARDIHPWDRGLLSPPQKAAAFVEQSLADTEAAIHRLFAALPQVDAVTVRVLDRASEHVIISGTVSRPMTSARDERFSVGIRLRYLGLTYYSAGSQFEALEENNRSAPVADTCGSLALRTEERLVNTMCRRDVTGRAL